MKKSIPKLEELVNRYYKQINIRHKHEEEIPPQAKQVLLNAWRGKEQRLYEKVKLMENEAVKVQNVKERVKTRKSEFQCGVDVLGFPIYVVHETLWQNDIDRKYKISKYASNQTLLGAKQYSVKQH